MAAPVLEALLVVELVEPLPGLHEGELPAEADLLLLSGPVEGARRPANQSSDLANWIGTSLVSWVGTRLANFAQTTQACPVHQKH